jgi:hypothetical protein
MRHVLVAARIIGTIDSASDGAQEDKVSKKESSQRQRSATNSAMCHQRCQGSWVDNGTSPVCPAPCPVYRRQWESSIVALLVLPKPRPIVVVAIPTLLGFLASLFSFLSPLSGKIFLLSLYRIHSNIVFVPVERVFVISSALGQLMQ